MDRVQQLVDDLIGTCKSRPEVLDDFSRNELFDFDAMTRRCECCDWWVPTDEIDEEGFCEECQQEAGYWATADGG